MAAHIRKQVRDYVVALLKTAATTAGNNVFSGRMLPLQNVELPAVKVDTLVENIQTLSIGVVRRLDRSLDLQIQMLVKKFKTYNDDIDELSRQIEVSLAGDNTLGGLVKYVNPSSFSMRFDEKSEYPAAEADMIFRVFYVTPINAPDTAA